MMNVLNLKRLCTGLVAVCLFAACDGKWNSIGVNGGNENGKGGQSLPPSAGGSSAPQQGTGDGGGGNAINNKMIESYQIDIAELPAFKSKVLPVLEKISKNERGELVKWWLTKTWYLVPAKLESVPREALGVEMIEGEIQQIAFQNRHDVFIDKNLFDKMSEEQQGTLIMHEISMLMYLTRFEKFSDLCDLYKKRLGKDCGSGEKLSDDFYTKFDSIYPPEERRKLNAEDYSAIRAMTKWMMTEGIHSNPEEFNKQQAKVGFRDPRYTDTGELVEQNKKISLKDFSQIIQSTFYTREMPSDCYSYESKQKTKCSMQIQTIKAPIYSRDWTTGEIVEVPNRDFIQLNLQSLDSQSSKSELKAAFPMEISLSYMNGYYSLALWSSYFDSKETLEKDPVGHQTKLVIFYLSSDLKRLVGVQQIPLIVTRIEERVEKTKMGSRTCKIAKAERQMKNEFINSFMILTDSESLRSKVAAWGMTNAQEMLYSCISVKENQTAQ